MAAPPTLCIHASVDAADQLIAAEEPLASFHQRCGGELPGPLLNPGLIALVRKSRAFGLKLARAVKVQDDREQVTMWVEVEPGSDVSRLTISNWRSIALSPGDGMDAVQRVALARQASELSARLGTRQELLAAQSACEELQPLLAQMREGIGRPWTDFVTLEGNAHHQPLHWRLLDGARLRLDGSDRVWTACIVPLGTREAGEGGFELHLMADQPPPAPAPVPVPAAAEPASLIVRGGIGRDVAPVLRQSVARIIANAETIRAQLAGPLAEEYSDYAADIASAGEHLLALLDDLATLEKVEAEDFAPAPDEIDLADVARRASGILGVRARERGISIDPPRLGESVPAIGEFRRVLQVLLNLVGNAIRYSPEGAQVWIRCEEVDGRARVIVADQGEGLTPEEQQKVFAKFERLGRSGDGGSGLGLYISRRLAEAMNGTLTVESAKGQGARFVLDLPADPAATSA